MEQTGKIILIIGILLTGLGLLIYFAGNKFSWFGHLPGDILIEKKDFRLYAPITSMLLVSMVISLVIWLVRKFIY